MVVYICDRGPETIGRLAVEGLGSTSWQLGAEAQAAADATLRAVLQIKALVRAAKCAACISVPAGASPSSSFQAIIAPLRLADVNLYCYPCTMYGEQSA